MVNRAGIQSSAGMAVIPLCTDNEMDVLADPTEVKLFRDPEYGRMEFENVGGKIGVVLQGWTVMTDQKAQDRAVPYSSIIESKKRKALSVNCLEPGPERFQPAPGHRGVCTVPHAAAAARSA